MSKNGAKLELFFWYIYFTFIVLFCFQRWHFSKSFEPVREWRMTEGSLAAVHEHLKVCLYNQDHVKNIKTEPFQILTDTAADNFYKSACVNA